MLDYEYEKLGLQEAIEPSLTVGETPEETHRRTFSHWSQFPHEFIDKLVQAGFYGCNIDDCVVCLNCSLMAHAWIPESDDPCQIHRCLSPDCKYVQKNLTRSVSSTTTNTSFDQLSNVIPVASFDQIETVGVEISENAVESQIVERRKSFNSWSDRDSSPSIEQFICAGFFYTGHGTEVKCFYCNGLLDEWKSDDDPAIKHVECFPNCKYIRQYLGEELYQKILRDKRLRLKLRIKEESMNTEPCCTSNTIDLTFDRLICIRGEDSTLLELVRQRLNWPMSKTLLDSGFSRSIVEKCWKNQLKFAETDFKSYRDLCIACIILQKYEENIVKRMNPIEPRVAMEEFRKNQCLSISGSPINPESSPIVEEAEKWLAQFVAIYAYANLVVPQQSSVRRVSLK